MLSCLAVIEVLGLNPKTVSLATIALDFPTCSFWKRNWRLRLLTSIVSKSICKKCDVMSLGNTFH